MESGEVTTVGMDGYVRVWFWETIDTTDPPDEDRFVEIEPIYDFWYCEFNLREVQNPYYKPYSCHDGNIAAAQVSSILPLLVTLDEDSKISVYDFEAKMLLLQKEFDKAGTDLVWLNGRISLSGMDLVANFEDDVICQIYVDLKAQSAPTIHLTRAIKARTAAVTKMTDRYTIWVSMGGYDAGYIYELQPGVKEPVHSTIIKDGDDCEIHSYLDRRDSDIGFSQCKLRLNQINPTDFTDMRNYLCFNMFDPLNGTIPSILSSCDGKSLISVGYDSNIFIYSWFGPDIRQIARRSNAFTMPLIIPSATDIIDPNYPSLEQQKIYAETTRGSSRNA
ncbi:hypothetical protein GQX74_004946 [Glossina fuscipes]|nr:hypothetical protein GQX74_004946 [Glossina fuscipes]